MPGPQTILAFLRDEDNPAADEALLAALPTADPPIAQAIVESLLLRDHPPGLYGLVALFHTLGDALRQLLLADLTRLFGVLRLASQSRQEQVRLNAIEVIRLGYLYRASYLLDSALHDKSPKVREAAAETLYALADELLRHAPKPEPNGADVTLAPDDVRERMQALETYAEDLRQVVGAIDSALSTFSVHLHARVVEAAMWFVDEMGAKFWSMVSTPGGRANHVAVSIISNSRDLRLIPFAMTALNFATFRAPVATLFEDAIDPDFLTEWLRQSWRLKRPKIARGMVGLKQIGWRDTSALKLLQVPADAQRHLGSWLAATGLSREVKIRTLRQCYRHGDPEGQRSAIHALIGLQEPEATSALQAIASQDTSALGRLARYEVARRVPGSFSLGDLLRELASPTANTPPATSTLPADEELSFNQYFKTFDRLGKEDRVRLGRQLLERVSTFRSRLLRRVREPDVTSCVRALRMISVLGLAGEFAEEVKRLGRHESPEVRSAVVAVLGPTGSAAGRRVVHDALNDRDVRVQANAVEAAEQLPGESVVKALMPKLTSPDNRVRANAVKALLKLGVREAAETLFHMLADSSRAQRVSALWLIDHMGLMTLLTRVMTMADDDDDDRVRERAKALADKLAPDPSPQTTRDEAPAEVRA